MWRRAWDWLCRGEGFFFFLAMALAATVLFVLLYFVLTWTVGGW
jgi:hypothetical protein